MPGDGQRLFNLPNHRTETRNAQNAPPKHKEVRRGFRPRRAQSLTTLRFVFEASLTHVRPRHRQRRSKPSPTSQKHRRLTPSAQI